MAGLSVAPPRASAALRRCRLGIGVAVAVMLLLPSPGRADGWFYRDNQIAYKLYRDGQDKQSLAHWDHSAEGLFGRGTVLMQMGRMHDAERAFRISLQLMPRLNVAGVVGGPAVHKGFLASIWYNLGNTLYAQDELKEAAAAWRKALDFEPEHAKARHNLDVVNRLLGKQSEDEDNPAGLAGKKKHAPKGKSPNGSGGKGSPPKQPPAKQKSGSQKGGGKKQAKAVERHQPGEDKDRNKKQDGRDGRSRAANGHGKNGPGKGKGSSEEDISVLQTEHELRLVEEGVSVFMRHRLNARHGQLEAPYRGPAW